MRLEKSESECSVTAGHTLRINEFFYHVIQLYGKIGGGRILMKILLLIFFVKWINIMIRNGCGGGNEF